MYRKRNDEQANDRRISKNQLNGVRSSYHQRIAARPGDVSVWESFQIERGSPEREKRRTSFRRCRSIDMARGISGRLDQRHVLPTLVNVPRKLDSAFRPHGAVVYDARCGSDSRMDGTFRHHRKRTAQSRGRHRSISLCPTSSLPCSFTGLHRNGHFILLSFFDCLIDSHLHLLQLYCSYEEGLLEAKFGEAYREYERKTGNGCHG